MIIRSNAHTHCNFCDGADSAEAMVKAALSRGFSDLGFSCHGYTPFETEYSLKDSCGEVYRAEIKRLKKLYAGQINISCGVEQDFYAPVIRRDYDYLIGSVHYLQDTNSATYYGVDADQQTLSACIEQMFGGDALAMVEQFYQISTENALKYKPDIIGHFDLVTKFNAGNLFFDQQGKVYQKIAVTALEQAAKSEAIFEINTGAVARGFTAVPYLAPFLLEYLQKLGGRVMISSDCHSAEQIDSCFDDALCLAKACGFNRISVLEDGEFREKAI